MDNEKHSTWNLTTRISNLLSKESSSDVEFLVGDPPQRYLGHRVILAAGSAVFETMFFGSLRQRSPVRVPDVEPRGFGLMLQYLYSDTVSIQDESDAFETAYAAKKYIIGSLFSVCENYLLDKLDIGPDNVFRIHQEAAFLEMKNLQNRCLRYVSRNAGKLFLCKSFTKASKDTFGDVLSLDLMNIESEKDIIEALWLWGKERCKEEGVDCSVENVRGCTKEFLKHVRFFALTMDELVGTLEKCQILDTSDEMALLWNFAMPRSRQPPKVPSNICTEYRTRSISNSSKIHFPGQYHYDGNMTSFLIENYSIKAEITVTGSPVTVIGLVIAFRPIPCYSCNDRSLEVQVLANNSSSRAKSGAKSRFEAEKEEEHRMLLLDNYIVIEEEQVASLTLIVSGEGVRLMQCADETLCYDLGKSEVTLKFGESGEDRRHLLPIRELMLL